MTKISPQQIVEKVRELAEADPDRVYQKPDTHTHCSYVMGGYYDEDFKHVGMGPCIVGAALQALGIPESVLDQMETGTDTSPSAGTLLEDGMLRERIEYISVRDPDRAADSEDLKRRQWLDKVQSHQDSGLSWRVAVAMADVEVPSMAISAVEVMS